VPEIAEVREVLSNLGIAKPQTFAQLAAVGGLRPLSHEMLQLS
jgi:hypothetical protein